MSFSFFKKLILKNHVYIDMSNEELMHLVANDDIEAFEYLYERLKRALYSYVYASLNNEQQAIEVVQDTFTKVYSNRKQYRSDYKVSTWIWSIARNILIDKFRKKDPLAFTGNEESDLDIISDESLSIEEALDKKLQRVHLQNCFKNLSEHYREIMALNLFGELSYDEICEVTNRSLQSVKGVIFKAKKQLKKCLQECMSNEEQGE